MLSTAGVRLSSANVELVALERRVAHVDAQHHTYKRQTRVPDTRVGYAIRIRFPDTHAEATSFRAHAVRRPSTGAVAGRAVSQLDKCRPALHAVWILQKPKLHQEPHFV